MSGIGKYRPSFPISTHALEIDPFAAAFAAFLRPAAAPTPTSAIVPAPAPARVFAPGLVAAPDVAPSVAPGFAPGAGGKELKAAYQEMLLEQCLSANSTKAINEPCPCPCPAAVPAAALAPAPIFAPAVALGIAPAPAPRLLLTDYPRARIQARFVRNTSMTDLFRWGWLQRGDMLMLGINSGGTQVALWRHIIAINKNFSVEVDILLQTTGMRVLLGRSGGGADDAAGGAPPDRRRHAEYGLAQVGTGKGRAGSGDVG